MLTATLKRDTKPGTSSLRWNSRMPTEHRRDQNTDQFTVYQIRLKGQLGHEWVAWFEGLTISLDEDGNTLLTGTVVDQAALYGILKKVRDLGMPLLSVNPTRTGSEDASEIAH